MKGHDFVFRNNLMAVYAVHRHLSLQKCIELSHSKNGKEMDSMDDLLGGFEELLAQTNLANREVFTWRECYNFLCRLLNNQLVPNEKLLRGLQALNEDISHLSHGRFISRMLEESKRVIEAHDKGSRDLSQSSSKLTQAIKRTCFCLPGWTCGLPWRS